VAVVKGPSRRDQLKDAHVAGRSARYSRDDVTGVMEALARGDSDARLGTPITDVTVEQAASAMEVVFGWNGDGPRARIDPKRAIQGFSNACARVVEVARAGGRLAFATTRPASLLGLYRALADVADEVGGDVLHASSASIDDTRRVWWVDGVAVVTDGESLLADASVAAADEWLFVLSRPDLVVADRTFAGTALAGGLEVVALADLDAVALAVAAWRGLAVRVAPFDQHRTPAAYEPLLGLIDEAVQDSEDPLGAHHLTAG
jgi:hypothetical protein